LKGRKSIGAATFVMEVLDEAGERNSAAKEACSPGKTFLS
jgi:hypothetical protein